MDPTASQPTPSSQPAALDPQAVNLAKAIRQTESGGDFTASGKSGEYGAYQYTPATWAKDSAAADVNVPLQKATPEQQNQVAYTKIKSLKDSGMNVGQIASIWNSGDASAYTGKFADGSPATGVNKYGVKYDVPAYAKSVANAYQQLKQGGSVQADPNNPSSVANTQNQPQESLGQKIIKGAGDVFNAFASPLEGVAAMPVQVLAKALGKPDPYSGGIPSAFSLGGAQNTPVTPLTPEAKAGDIAQVGSYMIPGATIPRLAAVGALQGAGQAMSQQQSPQQVAMSGTEGGVLGGGLGILGKGVSALAARTPETRILTQTQRLKTLQNAFEDFTTPERDLAGKVLTDATGQPVFRTPVQTMIAEKAMPSVVDGKVDASNALDRLDESITEQNKTARQLASNIPTKFDLNQLKNQAIQAVKNSPNIVASGKLPQALSELDKRFSSYEMSYGDKLSGDQLRDIQIAMNKEYDPEMRDTARAIGDTVRNNLYDVTGDPNLRRILSRESQLINARDFVQKLNGTAVKGGRLGKHIAALIGSGVGSALGSVGGPIGQGAGIIGGGIAGEKALGLLQNRYFTPIGAGAAGSVEKLLKSPAARLGQVGLMNQLLRPKQPVPNTK
jgi:hypothetical protein